MTTRYFKSNDNYVGWNEVCITSEPGRSIPCQPDKSWCWIEVFLQEEFEALLASGRTQRAIDCFQREHAVVIPLRLSLFADELSATSSGN